MAFTCSPLTRNNGNLSLPFLVVITLLFYWILFINNCICILTSSPESYLLMVIYGIQKTGVTRILQILST